MNQMWENLLLHMAGNKLDQLRMFDATYTIKLRIFLKDRQTKSWSERGIWRKFRPLP